MPTTNIDLEKQKLEKELAKIQKKIKTLQNKKRKPIIASIIKSMQDYDISPEDITTAFNRKTNKKTKSNTVKKPIPPKYRNPETDATWSGRGKTPRWIVDAEAAGTPREKFLIKKDNK